MTQPKLIGEKTTIRQGRNAGQIMSIRKVQHLLLHLLRTDMTKGFNRRMPIITVFACFGYLVGGGSIKGGFQIDI